MAGTLGAHSASAGSGPQAFALLTHGTECARFLCGLLTSPWYSVDKCATSAFCLHAARSTPHFLLFHLLLNSRYWPLMPEDSLFAFVSHCCGRNGQCTSAATGRVMELPDVPSVSMSAAERTGNRIQAA